MRMKTMLITGGARGIGAQMVRHFAAQGWRVMFCYQSSQEKAETLARETGALAVRCDVRDEAQVRAMLAQAMASLRHLDALMGGVFGLARGVLLLFIFFALVPIIQAVVPVQQLTDVFTASRLAPLFDSQIILSILGA